MRSIKRAALSLLALFVAAPAFYRLLGEAAVYYEMWSTDTSARAGLEDDFGLGLLWAFVVLPMTALCSFAAAMLVWVKSRRWGSDGHAA